MTDSDTWRAYYTKTRGRPPRPTVLRALDAFEAEGMPEDAFAVDLGCGGGRDTIEILRRGWRVLAIDGQQAAIHALLAREDIPDAAKTRLETLVSRLEDVEIPRCHLVNASFCLHGCPNDLFPALWKRIFDALRPGGRVSGQLLGERDSWADPARAKPGISAFSRAEVDGLLAPYAVEWLEENEEDSVTPRGEAKHWHFFHMVARKP